MNPPDSDIPNPPVIGDFAPSTIREVPPVGIPDTKPVIKYRGFSSENGSVFLSTLSFR